MSVISVNGETGVVVLTAADVGAVATSEVSQPGGVASLNVSGKLPEAQLPSSVVSSSPGGGVPAWKAKTAYAVNDLVEESAIVYICKEAHTSGETFSGLGTKWEVLAGAGAEYACPPPTGVAATDTVNVKAA
jgi:hypothetical protein